MEPERTIVLRLNGPLYLGDSLNTDRTPGSRKAQGILALLGSAPELKRSRSWLQDKLWSDRGPEQGAASLRQCLSEIRRCLGPHVDCLTARSGWVALDPDLVAVELTRPGAANGPASEFCEGLDVRDPEFEHWIRDQRQAARESRGTPAAPAPSSARNVVDTADRPLRPLLVVVPAQGAREDLRVVADMLTESLAVQVAQEGNAEVGRLQVDDPAQRGAGLTVSSRVAELGGILYLQFRLSDLSTGTVLWLDLREFDPARGLSLHDEGIARLIGTAVSVAVDELGRIGTEAGDQERLALLGYQASRNTILLDPAEQKESDRLLQRAFELDPRGIFLARRALLRHNQVVERSALSLKDARDDAIMLARRALELDPSNSIVVSTAAKVALNLEGKVEGGTELAAHAIRAGPNNPLAWDSRAIAHAHAGQGEQAFAAALKARKCASYLPQAYVWDMVCCLTATVAGRYDEAVEYGKRSRDLAPTFKPPLRYLAALHFHQGNIEAARRQIKSLQALEPSFELEQLDTVDYPAAGLRHSPLIAVAHSGLL